MHWIYTLLHLFNGPFSRTTWVSRYQKGRTIPDFAEARDDGVAVASAGPYAKHFHFAREITTPVPHISVFYRPDALPATQPTVLEH